MSYSYIVNELLEQLSAAMDIKAIEQAPAWLFRIALRDRLTPALGPANAQKIAGMMEVRLPVDLDTDSLNRLVDFYTMAIINVGELYARDFPAVDVAEFTRQMNVKIE